jgi:hypothetical protein
MAKKIALEIDVKSDSVSSAKGKVENATQELRRLKRELASGELKGEAFEEASKRAGILEDRIGDVSARVRNLASDTRGLDTLVSAAQGIAGGFAVAQGAAALFGDENEELQKTFVKLQATMTALNGLQAVANTLNKDSAFMTNLSAKAFKLKAAATNMASSSLGKFKLALIATGVGAFVVVLGLVIANFEKIKNAVLNLFPGLAKLGSFISGLVQSFTDFVGITSEANRAADRFAKLSERINQQGKDDIAVMKARGATTREVYEAENKLIYQRLNDLEKLRQLQGKLTEEQIAERKALIQELRLLESSELKRIEDERAKELEANKKANEDRRKQNKADFEKRQQEAEQLRQQEMTAEMANLQRRAQLIGDEFARELELLSLKHIQERAAAEKAGEDISLLAQVQNQELEDFEAAHLKNIEDIRQDARDKEKAAREKAIADEKTYAEDTIAAYQQIEDAKIEIAQLGGMALQQLAGKNKALALAGLALEKGSAIANVIINTQREIAGYYAAAAARSALTAGTTTAFDQALATKQSLFAKVRAGAAIGAIGAAGLNSGRNLGGGSQGSGGGGSLPSQQFQPPTLNQQTQGIRLQDQRVYVLESDISKTQRRVKTLEGRSVID